MNFRWQRTVTTISVLSAAVAVGLLFGVTEKGMAAETCPAAIQVVVEQDLKCGVKPEILDSAVVENYALVPWLCGKSGGQTLLKNKSNSGNNWVVLDGSGGAWEKPAELEKYGVPAAIASRLMSDLNQ